MHHLKTSLLLASLFFAGTASAEVAQADATSFLVTHRIVVAANGAESFKAITHPERWWNPEHTWSGNANNLRLDPRAGGCWCERWSGGQVEHGRVLFIKTDSLLRVSAALGPLQAMAVNAVLDFQLTPGKDGTQIELSYRVSGPASAKLDEIAPGVDKVLGEQVARLKSLLEPKAPAATH